MYTRNLNDIGPGKPVSRVLCPSVTGRTAVIYLGRPLLEGSSDQPGDGPGALLSPYLILLRMGFARPPVHTGAGELLPRHFTLILPFPEGRYVSVALSVGFPHLDVIQHPARRSSDFPHRLAPARPPGFPGPSTV